MKVRMDERSGMLACPPVRPSAEYNLPARCSASARRRRHFFLLHFTNLGYIAGWVPCQVLPRWMGRVKSDEATSASRSYSSRSRNMLCPTKIHERMK